MMELVMTIKYFIILIVNGEPVDHLEFDPNTEEMKAVTIDGNTQYLDLGTGKIILNCKHIMGGS